MPYVIRPGDTLYAIALRFGVSLRDLLAANPQLSAAATIYPGQTIEIPSPAQPSGTFTYMVRSGDTFWRIAGQFGISVEALAAANPQVTNPASLQVGQILYVPRRPEQPYIVQPGDTFWRIAQKFGITVQQLMAANPGVDPTRLMVGQRIIIPAAEEMEIVVPREGYGYDEMMADLRRLKARYPFIQIGNIGNTVLGRPIPVVRIGTGAKEVHYNASMHAEEWINTILMMKFLETYAQAYQRGENIGSYNPRALYEETSLWLVPMVNPDGVELQQNGITADNPYYDLVMKATGGTGNVRNWVANIRGVDLNNQFPAEWEREAGREATAPGPRGYSGPAPLSEPESRALAEFTRAHDFRLVIAWHTQGEEIYWGYMGREPAESESIALRFADISGYTPVRYVESFAGYKDWFITEFRRPGFTIETGKGTNPLPVSQFWQMWSDTLGVLLAGLDV